MVEMVLCTVYRLLPVLCSRFCLFVQTYIQYYWQHTYLISLAADQFMTGSRSDVLFPATVLADVPSPQSLVWKCIYLFIIIIIFRCVCVCGGGGGEGAEGISKSKLKSLGTCSL